MPNIIIISGKQYSGKDTLAKMLLEKMHNFKRIGIGDAIKIKYAKEHNITLDEVTKNKHLYREDLIKLGNWGRAQDSEYWLKLLSNRNNIIVPDIRMIYEAEYFRKKGAFLIRVNSNYENRMKRGIITNENDCTETALDCYDKWDMVIENNSSMNDLANSADEVIYKFNKRKPVN